MSLILGDIDKEALTALVNQSGAELDQTLKPLIDQAQRLNDNFTALIILLSRLEDRGLTISINLQPEKKS